MTFTFDLVAMDIITQVRVLIRDKDSTNVLFQDEELQMFLDQNSNDLYLTAADVLVALSANAALLHKLERTGDYTIDSKGMSDALLKAATRFRSLSEDMPAFDSVELNLSDFNQAQIIWNDLLRTT